jgi:hypothetical protein
MKHQTMKHRNCEYILAFALGKGVQYRMSSGEWADILSLRDLDYRSEYRLKPKTQIINGIEVPGPMTVWPKRGASCFYPDITVEKFYGWFDWQDHEYSSHEYSRRLFDRGLIFENEEDAITVAKAMLGILNTVDDPESD